MGNSPSKDSDSVQGKKEGLGSTLLENAGYLCGSAKDADDKDATFAGNLLQQADAMCISSPKQDTEEPATTEVEQMNPTSALFARALVSEVTDNPRTMTPAAMAERERRLLKAQEAARKNSGSKPVGTMGQPNLLGSLAHALKGDGDEDYDTAATPPTNSVVPPNSLLENRAQVATPPRSVSTNTGKHTVTIGLSLSRRHSSLGHPDTVTRQTAFDFNELQDRQYKFVSSTDSSGWMAGGGEPGGNHVPLDTEDFPGNHPNGVTSMLTPQGHHKLAAPDTVHIPIIQIDAESPAVVNTIVSALARGEVFIPHMSILPEALSVNGISPPDLVVRFGCERNEDTPPEEWPNWCLEFMHNQLYDYFKDMGAIWRHRPFQITLARKVRWKTVKHMNRYFAHAERVIDAWREKGPQYLDPQLSYIEGGATPEEVARPHGIYLLKNGIPTNYFAPNFDPPYTTKMTRSLLLNVLSKSWDKKRREWTSEPVARLVTPSTLMASMCGCADPNQGGFLASEVTNANAIPMVTSPGVPTADMAAAVPPFHVESREDQEEEQANLADISLSKSAASTKVSSVLLTPFETPKEAAPGTPKKPDPMPTLNTTLEEDFDLNDSSEEMQDITKNSDTPNSKKDAPERVGGKYGRSPTPELVRFRSRSPATSSPPDGTEVAPSTAPSMATATTVAHMNSSSARLVERDKEWKKAHEEKKEATSPQSEVLEQASSEQASSLENITPKSSSSPNSGKKKKKNRSKVKEAYEKERARQIAMIALAQEETNKVHSPPRDSKVHSPPKKEGLTVMDDNAQPKYKMAATASPTQKGQEMRRNDSGSVSLEYSIDSSMMGGGDASTLAGQYISADGSTVTAGSRPRKAEEESDSQTTNTSEPTVPSDEELFAVGWAKALDPKSGSYYYFTLDRSKIVWDNPLAPEDSTTAHTDASSSIPA